MSEADVLTTDLKRVLVRFVKARDAEHTSRFETLTDILVATMSTVIFVVKFCEKHNPKDGETFRRELCSQIIDRLLYGERTDSADC